MILYPYRVRFRNLLIHGANGFHLNHFPLLCRIAIVSKHYGSVFRHTLLRNDSALTPTHNEVATHILWTFTEIHGIHVFLLTQQTEAATNHYRYLAKMCIREDTFMRRFTTVRIIRSGCSDLDIHCKWRGIC